MIDAYYFASFVSPHPLWNSFIQLSTLIVAALALIVAIRNLAGLRRTQSIQSHMNLENDIRKNRIALRLTILQYTSATSIGGAKSVDHQKMEKLQLDKTSAFELYISSVDKLASLINTRYLKKQFPNRNWKEEYLEIFQDAKRYMDTSTEVIPGKTGMIKNLVSVLDEWDLNPQ